MLQLLTNFLSFNLSITKSYYAFLGFSMLNMYNILRLYLIIDEALSGVMINN